jgi:hypothetical protein
MISGRRRLYQRRLETNAGRLLRARGDRRMRPTRGGDDGVHHLGFEARAARSAYRPRKLPNPPTINAAVPIPNSTYEKGNNIRLLTISPALPS